MTVLAVLFLSFSVYAQSSTHTATLPQHNIDSDNLQIREIELPPRNDEDNQKQHYNNSMAAKNLQYLDFLEYYLSLRDQQNKAEILWQLSDPDSYEALKNDAKLVRAKQSRLSKYVQILERARDENFGLNISLNLGKYDQTFQRFVINKIKAPIRNYQYRAEAFPEKDFQMNFFPPKVIKHDIIQKNDLPSVFGLRITNDRDLRFLKMSPEIANELIATMDYTSSVNCYLELGTPTIIKDRIMDKTSKKFLPIGATYHFRYKKIKCFEDRAYRTQISLID